MIRLPRDMSQDDVSQWLQQGVYLVRRKRAGVPVEWIPCAWQGMDGGRVVSVSLLNDDILRTAHTSCAAVWPELGSFNHPRGYAVHLGRVVERQYRRTFHSRALEVVVPWAYRAGMALDMDQSTMQNWHCVKALPFISVWPESFDDAMLWLESGKPTVAINRRLIVAGDGRTDKRLLYLDGRLVANMVGGMLMPTCTPADLAVVKKMVGGRFNVI
jgi:hypothetical protein